MLKTTQEETTLAETETETPTESPMADESPTETTAGKSTGTATASPTEQGEGGGANTVRMVTDGTDYYFDPIGLFVEPGDTVTWIIESGSHTSTAYEEGNGPAEVTRIPDDGEAWDSGTLSEEGATFEHTFDATGTYDYYCIPHKQLGMIGRLVVGEPGGPAEGSQPPDGEVPESDTIVEEGSISWEDFSG